MGAPSSAEDESKGAFRPATQSASPSSAASQPPPAPGWVPPPVSDTDAVDPLRAVEVLADTLQRVGRDSTEEEADVLSRLAQVLQFSVRGVVAMHAMDPKARASMDFMVQFAADTLSKRGDSQGAALMACFAAILAGVQAPQAKALPADVSAALATAERRAAQRGWLLVPPAQRSSRAPPATDPDDALKDCLGHCLLCFSSRLQWSATQQVMEGSVKRSKG